MKPHRRIAGGLALLICANIALVLVCELRCEVPASATTSAGACHGSGSTVRESESPMTIADGALDRCEHDALPAVTIAAIKKDVRVTAHTLTPSTRIGELEPARTSLAITDRSATAPAGHATPTVLRI